MRFLIGSIVVLILALVAVLANRPGEYSFNDKKTAISWQQPLKEQLNDVTKLEIHQALQPPLVIEKVESTWVVPSLAGYPAKVDQLRNTLLSLAQFELVQPMTSKPEKYATLQLQDVNPPSDNTLTSQPILSKATLVKVFIDQPKPAASLLLGRVSMSGTGINAKPQQYVRQPEERQTWRINQVITAPKQATGWVDTTVLNIREASIKQLTVRQLNSAGKTLNTLTATRKEQDGPFAVPGLKNADASKVTAELGGMLERLQFADVLPRDQLEVKESAGRHIITGETFDGLTTTLELVQDTKGTSWALISATVVDTVKVGDAADAAAKNIPSTSELQAATINSRGKQWAYQLPEGRVKGLQAKKGDFVKK